MAACILQLNLIFLLIFPFTLFSADHEQHNFEQYKPGLYVRLHINDCIFVSPEVEFGGLPPDITNKIMRFGLRPAELFVLRCVNKSLAKNIIFYINNLRDTDFKTGLSASLLSYICNEGFKEVENERAYKMQACLEIAKRGSFFVNSLHVDPPFCEWGKNILEALIENKTSVITPYGSILCKKGDITWLEGKLPHNEYVQNVWIKVDEMSATDERALGKIVKKCTNLKSFCVRPDGKSKAQVSDCGAKAIAEQVGQHKKIEWLELVSSNIGDIGAHALAAALRENESLHVLRLGGNCIGREGMEELIAAGEKHKKLRGLGMEHNLPPGSNECVSAYKAFKGDQSKNWVSWEL